MDGGSRQRRLTRRQARESRRQTRRFQWEQAGGANIVPYMELPAAIDGETLDPATELKKQLPETLRFITEKPVITVGLPSTASSPANAAVQYFTILQHQDVITRAVLRTIYVLLGLPADVSDEKQIIRAWIEQVKGKPVKQNQIKDIIRAVRNLFVLIPEDTGPLASPTSGATGGTVKSRPTPQTRPKLDDFLFADTTSRGTKEQRLENEILELMLYPKRMENIFVESVAQIINTLLVDDSALVPIRTIADDNTKKSFIKLLAFQYTAYVNSLAYSTTNRKLRDTFSAMSAMLSEDTLITFFDEFLTTILTEGPDPRISADTTNGVLTGIIFRECKNGRENISDKILRKLSDVSKLSRPVRIPDTTVSQLYGFPDPAFTVPPLIEGVTFGSLLRALSVSQTSAETLHFLIHLLYTLEHSTATAPPTMSGMTASAVPTDPSRTPVSPAARLGTA